jgi:SAM-dependent methyltransferase
LDNAKFWNERYQLFPQLGSGPGSRGYAAAYKNALVKKIVIQREINSIVDIGCGDLCWLDPDILKGRSYCGLDISTTAIERARAAYPSLQFAVYDAAAEPLHIEGDLVVCFDLFIHLLDIQSFHAALSNTLPAIRKFALFSYRTPPMTDGNFPPPAFLDPAAPETSIEAETRFQQMMTSSLPANFPRADTAFHAPLPEAVTALRPDLEVSVAGRYRYQTVYAIRPLVAADVSVSEPVAAQG